VIPISVARRLLRAVTAPIAVAVAALAALAGLAWGASSGPAATGAAPTGYRVAITQAIETAAGNPFVVANFAPDGSLAQPSISVCPPPNVQVCQLVSRHGVFRSGPEPAGTVFEATATYRGVTYTARSPAWQGRVTESVPPRLAGRAAYRSRVTPVAARWGGGWGTDYDELGIEACRSRSGRRCVVLSQEGQDYAGPKRFARVGTPFSGWYLFATDQRSARDTFFAGVGYAYAGAVPPPRRARAVVRSAAMGPVTGPPAPTVMILHPARVSGGRAFVARVHCTVSCRAFVVVTGTRAGDSSRQVITGTREVGVRRARVNAGPLSVLLHVDDGPLIRAATRLP
jgi:hypothetical protein